MTKKHTNKLLKWEKNNDYTAGNLLDYESFSKNYKLIAIDLSKQIELEDVDLKQQFNFIGRLKKNEGATMFFVIEKSKKQLLNFRKMLQQLLGFDYV